MPNDHVQALVQRTQAGDADAWRQLHDLMSPYLLRVAQGLLGPAWPIASWHNLVQMTWQRAWQSFTSFRGGPDDDQTRAVLRAWLRQIMRNVHANMVRARDGPSRLPSAPVISLTPSRADGSAHVVEPQAPDPSPSHALRAEERTARIEEALAQLTDPLDRRVIELVYFESRSFGEAAEELGLSYDQVRYRLDKVLARLGEYLKEPP